MERETGIEPATNSLEGCDSTTELLPPSASQLRLTRPQFVTNAFGPPLPLRGSGATTFLPSSQRKKVGGEARIRTLVAAWAADLQSAAIDRSATSPGCSLESFALPDAPCRCRAQKMELAKGFEPPTG